MARPLHIEIVAPVKIELDSRALQFIDDGAVINALDGYTLAVNFVEKAAPIFLDPGDVDGANAQHFFRHSEVRKSLLPVGIDFHQDHVFRIVVGYNGAPQKSAIGRFVEASQKILEVSEPGSRKPEAPFKPYASI